MTSPRQIEANRRNARLSTGPRTEAGKRRSRLNALRHGLAAETVIDAFEQPAHYKKFQAAIVSDYAPQSTVEHELALRIASLLWRLRRATAIETGLFAIEAAFVNDPQNAGSCFPPLSRSLDRLGKCNGAVPSVQIGEGQRENGSELRFVADRIRTTAPHPSRHIAQCFVRLANAEQVPFERVGQYEARLWRQLAQTVMLLDMMRRSKPDWRPLRKHQLSRLDRLNFRPA